jgi:hypothetical protein
MLRFADWADFADEAISLRHAYMEEGIVTRSSSADALHVALATINRCNILVSWNCRHIVHFQKIPLYNAVNVRLGFGVIAIHTPLEVISDEEEGV